MSNERTEEMRTCSSKDDILKLDNRYARYYSHLCQEYHKLGSTLALKDYINLMSFRSRKSEELEEFLTLVENQVKDAPVSCDGLDINSAAEADTNQSGSPYNPTHLTGGTSSTDRHCLEIDANKSESPYNPTHLTDDTSSTDRHCLETDANKSESPYNPTHLTGGTSSTDGPCLETDTNESESPYNTTHLTGGTSATDCPCLEIDATESENPYNPTHLTGGASSTDCRLKIDANESKSPYNPTHLTASTSSTDCHCLETLTNNEIIEEHSQIIKNTDLPVERMNSLSLDLDRNSPTLSVTKSSWPTTPDSSDNTFFVSNRRSRRRRKHPSKRHVLLDVLSSLQFDSLSEPDNAGEKL